MDHAIIDNDDCEMDGVDENVDTKAHLMHEGRGRVRTSNKTFAIKEFVSSEFNSVGSSMVE